MARKSKKDRQTSGFKILLVDDNADYLEATRILLENEGHDVLGAASGPQALELLRREPVDLVLLDYFMPGMTGEEVVAELRTFNPFIQVILQTGYASEQPPRALLKRLDIQGYFDKGEGPDKLLLWTDVGLKAAYTVQLLHRSRQGLRHILDVTPELHKLQSLQHLLRGVLLQVTGLVGASSSFLAVVSDPAGGSLEPNGFVAVVEGDSDLVIRVGTGNFARQSSPTECLPSEKVDRMRVVMQLGTVEVANGATIVPLQVGSNAIGVVYLDRPADQGPDLELIRVFANQAAVAIQNTQLYEMATLDPLTGVNVRRFFDQWFLRELRVAFRQRRAIALLLMDLDDFKKINDEAGHLTGDQALAATGRVLREAVRAHDVVGRFGGDEFAILLPQTDVDGADQVGRRILSLLSEERVLGPSGTPYPLKASLGLAVLSPHTLSSEDFPRPVAASLFQTAAHALLQQADQALYRGKRAGGGTVEPSPLIFWPSLA
jgi:diguanylate cyclase (GGDEF)-like protein